ncbi:hypothetical protein EV424DRAFT_1440905 [Suillus variegatus]|nr:hypothetical protein EV424DRAFT_1440905 [Suillus variegatus]
MMLSWVFLLQSGVVRCHPPFLHLHFQCATCRTAIDAHRFCFAYANPVDNPCVHPHVHDANLPGAVQILQWSPFRFVSYFGAYAIPTRLKHDGWPDEYL